MTGPIPVIHATDPQSPAPRCGPRPDDQQTGTASTGVPPTDTGSTGTASGVNLASASPIEQSPRRYQRISLPV